MATIKYFLIYNPQYGTREDNDHEKLLYFYPEEWTLNDKMKAVGLTEGLVNFSKTFSDDPVQSMHTKKGRRVFFSPEPDCWMSLAVTLPSREIKQDGKVITEYHDSNVLDCSLRSLLSQSYDMFRLMLGTINNALDAHGREKTADLMNLFFSRYVPEIDIANMNLVDSFNGMRQLPLEKAGYLKVQCFIALIERTFRDAVKSTVFMHDQCVVWSGVEQADMTILYRYLLGSPELKKRAAKQASGFLFGPADASPQAAIDVPWLHVHIDGVLTRLPMVAYQCSRTVCCLFVEPSKASEMDMYAHLQALVKPKMEELDAELQAKQASLAALSEQFPPEAQYKYVYFNHVNRAEKSTFLPLLKSERSGRVGSKLSPEEQAACRSSEVRIMGDMHEDFVLGGPQHDCEIIAQTASGPWVVGRQTESREFFVNLTNKSSANLTEIQDEIRKLTATQFGNIFLLD